MQGGFVNGVKVKKVEERDSVLGSVGGAREQTQTQTRPPSRPRDGNWDLDSDGSAQTARRPAQLWLATAAALAVASDRHESHELGARRAAGKGVAVVPGCPGQPACERTLQVPNYSAAIYCLPSHMLRPTKQGIALKCR